MLKSAPKTTLAGLILLSIVALRAKIALTVVIFEEACPCSLARLRTRITTCMCV